MDADSGGATGFDRAVEDMLVQLREEAGAGVALVELNDPDDHGRTWKLSPRHAQAAEIWVSTAGHESVIVAFEPSSRFELGWQRDASPVDVLRELEDICRSIIAGRLVVTEKLPPSGSTKYRLTLTDGEVFEGSVNWLLPRMPWTRVRTISYEPY